MNKWQRRLKKKKIIMDILVRFSSNNIILTLEDPVKFHIFSLSRNSLKGKGSDKKKLIEMETLAIAELKRFLLRHKPYGLIITCAKDIPSFRQAFYEMLLKINSPIKYMHFQPPNRTVFGGCELPPKKRKTWLASFLVWFGKFFH